MTSVGLWTAVVVAAAAVAWLRAGGGDVHASGAGALAQCQVERAAAQAAALAGPPPPPSLVGSGLPAWVTPEVLHAKLFGGALAPVGVVPNWRHADDAHPAFHWAPTGARATFAVATHLTADRLPALARLCASWAGPVSAALHWDPSTGDTDADRAALRAAVDAAVVTASASESSQNSPGCALDVHLVIDTHPFVQLNLWRNVARMYARPAYQLMLDVDFVPDKGLRAALEGDRDRWVSWLNQDRVLVVPAFEPVATDAAAEDVVYPAAQADLLAQLDAGTVRVFHADWFHGQGHTNYTHWRTATAPYRPETYHFKWEPYVVHGPSMPWCDEGFIGFGSNKCACIVAMWMAGAEFWVLPTHFLVHQPHPTLPPDADDAARTAARLREHRRVRENEANVATLRRFLDVLEVRYGRRAPIVAANPGAAVSMRDGTALPS